ncbi:hypothetical protein [Lacimonas salitolerans]|uniref:Uncharacterized protein n=1 Tax=Lacimonas salitolerans TaxID=1323750 RepID=A0ABW4EDE8_9RHOB
MLQQNNQPQDRGGEAWILFRPGLVLPPPPLPEPICDCHSVGDRVIRRVVEDRVLPELLARFRQRGQG